jgi:threonine aldolase
MHLDGARCLNAAAYLKMDVAEMCKDFDTISFCLSKGLGCPIGSLLVGSKEDITYCLILRKLLGGNMRQVGIIAKAGLVNLEYWRD